MSRTATLIPLALIAKRMRINPKVARSRLRRALDSKNPPVSTSEQRWMFPKSQVPAIQRVIRAD